MRDPNQRRYSLTEPCATCPFRSDLTFELGSGRAQEISDGLLAGDEFWCHKTVDYHDVSGSTASRTRACAGARATLANERKSTTLLQITQRLSSEPVSELRPDLPVYPTMALWVASKEES